MFLLLWTFSVRMNKWCHQFLSLRHYVTIILINMPLHTEINCRNHYFKYNHRWCSPNVLEKDPFGHKLQSSIPERTKVSSQLSQESFTNSTTCYLKYHQQKQASFTAGSNVPRTKTSGIGSSRTYSAVDKFHGTIDNVIWRL